MNPHTIKSLLVQLKLSLNPGLLQISVNHRELKFERPHTPDLDHPDVARKEGKCALTLYTK